ncbi:MAG: hypothetical protein WB564_04920 [Dehalococcoidia bacterium]
MSRPAHILRAIWIHMSIPLTVLTLYFVSFSLFLSWLLPEYSRNVNATFVDRAWKYSFILAAVSYLICSVIFRTTKGNKLIFGDSIERVRAIDFILILLPLTPVVQYILNNQDILSPLGSLCILAVFAVFSVLFVIAIPTLLGIVGSTKTLMRLGIVGSTKTLMFLGVAFTFIITSMAYFSDIYHWLEEGSLVIQLSVFSAIFLVGRILYSNQIGRKFTYFFVVIFLIAGIAFQIMPHGWSKTPPTNTDSTESSNTLVELVNSKKPLSTPNIYLLIYDAYATNEAMLGYGIDNSAQEEYLEALGFKLYPHTYSVGSDSIATMSRVLQASTEYYGNWRSGVSGNGTVQNLLKSFGYETYGIFQEDYFFQGTNSSYDFTFPKAAFSTWKLLVKAIFMGEFRFNVEFGQPSREQFVEYKISTFKNMPNKPRFVYMHDTLPGHSQNSGRCLPNEVELYQERLIQANYQMKQDVETIIQNDPGAIIIVASDHGPYLTKNCIGTGSDYDISEISRLDIQDRFGTFLAIKWPTEDFSEYDDITVLQDIFPAIFAYLFKDATLLEAKVEPDTLNPEIISGAQVKNGIIYGGINDGEPLFVNQK